ncbi:MAG TPA: arylamine N-acetyltransferase [Ilumatobacteraceae bacterium]
MDARDVDVDRYLERIGFGSRVTNDADCLAALQLGHLEWVPFENLHVHSGIPVRTTLDWSVPKIVEQRRGGWCFELNGAFSALLRAIGFDVTLHSAQVSDARSGELGPPLDHLCLIATVDGTRWLTDVGFGDSSVTPVLVDHEGEQDRQPLRCRTAWVDGRLHYSEQTGPDEWTLQYVVDPTPRTLEEFQPRSDELASGAGGPHWTEKPFATRALDDHGGRVWLLRDRVKVRRGGGWEAPTEEPVDAADWDATLLSWFGMTRPRA